MNNLAGITVNQRYHIIEPLGRGGMATVYKALDTTLERTVAIKVIRTEEIPPSQVVEMLKRFRREARAVARLDHPNIIKVYDYGEYEGAPYLVMQYMPRGSLKVKIGKPIPYREATSLLLPVARALSYAHQEGIIHRDVKPANILISRDGMLMLSDFGIAKVLEEAGTTHLTSTGMGIGTPEYMPPEQWIGKSLPQTDIYALGVVLFELVTGRKPYIADTPAALLIKVVNDPLPRPRTFAPDLPEAMENVLFKALAKQLELRYASMADFAAALEKMLSPQVEKGLAGHLKSIEKQPAKEVPKAAAAIPTEKEPLRTALREPASLKATTPTANQLPPAPPLPPMTGNRGWLWILGGVGMLSVILVGIILIVLLVNQNINKTAQQTQTALAALLGEPTVGVDSEPVSTTKASPAYTQTLEPTQTVMDMPSPTSTSTVTLTPSPTSTLTQTNTPTLGIGATMVSERDGMVLVYVPEGAFLMGTGDERVDVLLAEHSGWQRDWFTVEQPEHTVSLDAYWIDQTEVTNVMYAQCVADGGCIEPVADESSTHNGWHYGSSEYANYPMVWVNWYHAQAYCTWAGRRLLTEAEWEKAARGTDGRTYPWGESIDCSLANYWGKEDGCVGDTMSVGSYPGGASPYGALDMAGNVFEWTADWFDPNYYSNSPESNPTGPSSGENRVMRGGSWGHHEGDALSFNRLAYEPTYAQAYFGFRCALSP